MVGPMAWENQESTSSSFRSVFSTGNRQRLEPFRQGAPPRRLPLRGIVPTPPHQPWCHRRVMAGVDLVTVKEIMGHQDIETTLRYAHLAPHHLKDGVNRGSLYGIGMKTGSGTLTKTLTKGSEPVVENLQVIDSVVRPTGLEPVTPRSVVWCSIH